MNKRHEEIVSLAERVAPFSEDGHLLRDLARAIRAYDVAEAALTQLLDDEIARSAAHRREIVAAHEERDNGYRGRAEVLAALAKASYGSVLVHGADPEAAEWPVLYLHNWLGQQLSWHIAPGDMDLFEGVLQVQDGDPDAPVWDGHDNAEKARRLQVDLDVHHSCM